MNQLRELHREAVLDSVRVVLLVGADDFERSTPCDGWTLRDLLRHMIVQHRGFAAAASGRITTLDEWLPSSVATDLVLDYLDSSAHVIRAFADQSLGSRWLLLPEISTSDTVSVKRAMGFHLVDYVVHAWDVAKAIGVHYQPSAAVAEAAWQVASRVPNSPERVEPGSSFAPSLDVGSDAPMIDRIVATLGRSPAWPSPAV